VKTVIVNDEIGSIGFIGAVIIGANLFSCKFSAIGRAKPVKLLIMKKMADF
jgi:hypothetical protein